MNLIIFSNLKSESVLKVNMKNFQAGQEFLLILTPNNQINLIESLNPPQHLLDNYFTKIQHSRIENHSSIPLLKLKMGNKRKNQIFVQQTGKTTVLNHQMKHTEFFEISSPVKLNLILNQGRQVELNLKVQAIASKFQENSDLEEKQEIFHKIVEESPSVSNTQLKSSNQMIQFSNNPAPQYLSPKKNQKINGLLLEEFHTPLNKNQPQKNSTYKFGTGSTKLPPFTSSRSPKSGKLQNQSKISSFFPIPRMPSLENKHIFGTPKNSRKGILPKSSDIKFKKSKKKFNKINSINLSNSFSDITYIICFSNLSKLFL